MQRMKSHEATFHPFPLRNPCADSRIITASTATIIYQSLGKALRKPALRATLTAMGCNHVPGLERKGYPGTLMLKTERATADIRG